MELPKKVNIIEVGPRDGLQNEKKDLTTDEKIVLIHQLFDSGISEIQVTAFVHPKWVPQMKDAKEVIKAMADHLEKISALIPNEKGLDRAIDSGIKKVDTVISISETHNQKNINQSTNYSVEQLKLIAKKAKKNDISLRVSLATSFGCRYEGKISTDRVVEIVKRVNDIGVDEIFLADTVGMGNPLLVHETFKRIKEILPKSTALGVHLHDTQGTGLANAFAALMAGVDRFDASIGGLGGCPFATGASGNISTEDLVSMFHDMGVETGINLDKLLLSVGYLEHKLKKTLPSKMKRLEEGLTI